MSPQKPHTPTLSFEFFPPKHEQGVEQLARVRQSLAALAPAYFSVTFGAGGSTRDLTLETVLETRRATGIEAAPHLSCVGSTRAQLREILASYIEHDIRRIIALRGDMPSGTAGGGDFRYAAELVEFIRAETGSHFIIEVAAYPEFHPQTENASDGLKHFKAKVDAGADAAITQYFYAAEAYFRFVDDCAKMGVNIPIVPGIMPITNFSDLRRFSEACGAEIPRWIRKRLEDFADDKKSIRAFGADVVADLCDKLLTQGAPGLHIYSMNLSKPALAVCERLGLMPKRSVEPVS